MLPYPLVGASSGSAMNTEHKQFMSRVRNLERKHEAMGNGYTAKIRSDGLIVVAPKKFESRISPRSVVLFLVAFMAFKGFLVASIGLLSYEDRLAKLQDGSILEKAGAVVMTADPLTLKIAEQIKPLLP